MIRRRLTASVRSSGVVVVKSGEGRQGFFTFAPLVVSALSARGCSCADTVAAEVKATSADVSADASVIRWTRMALFSSDDVRFDHMRRAASAEARQQALEAR